MAQDFTVRIGLDDSVGKKLGRELATAIQGGAARISSGSKPGMGGGAAESLLKMIPGGGFFTNIGKAFAQGGLFVGMAAGITGFVAIGKGLLSNSKLMQTMTGTFFKTIGAMIDMMLAPLMPLFMKFLGWWISEGFKWAQLAGQYLSEKLPELIDKIGSVIDFFGGMKTIFTALKWTLGIWFTMWVAEKAFRVIRGGAKGAIGLGRKLFGRGGAKAGKTLVKDMPMADKWARAFPKAPVAKAVGKGGLRRGLGRLGAGLATRTGAKAALRVGTGFIAKRAGSMMAGAAIGGTIGLAGAGVGAIPGSIIGAIAGLAIGQAAGVAIDAATGQEISVKSALIPGYSELRDARKIMAAGDEKALKENAAQTKAAAETLNQEIGRDLDASNAALVGRPDSIVPQTMGTLMGVYGTMQREAELAQERMEQHDTGDKGFWGTWNDRIKGVWNGAWGIVQGWWNGIFGNSPGAATADGGSPAEDAIDYDGDSFWPGWLSGIGGFFKGAWGVVKGWWGKITGGAEDNQPVDPHTEDDSGSFFPGWVTDIGGLFKSGWGIAKGWWNSVFSSADENPATDPHEEDDSGTFFPGWVTDIGGLFKSGWGIAKGWWSSAFSSADENPPVDPHEEDDSGTFFPGWVTDIGDLFKSGWGTAKGWWNSAFGSADENPPVDPHEEDDSGSFFPGWVTDIGGLFKSGWGIVKGWWSGLKSKSDENQPKTESDPKEATIGTTLKGIILNPIGSLVAGFKKGWGVVQGWWSGLRDKQDENEPDPNDVPAPTVMGRAIGLLTGLASGALNGLKQGFSRGWGAVKGWWKGLKDESEKHEPKVNPGDQGIISRFFSGWSSGISKARDIAWAGIQASWNALSSGVGAVGGALNKLNPFSSNNVGGIVSKSDIARGGWAFQTGGVVPGPQGALGLAMVHADEMILPTHLGPDWLNSTKGGTDFKRAMTGTASGWNVGGGAGGGGTTHMTMNRPTIINISTSESTMEVLQGLAQLEMLEDAAFFSSLA